MMNRLETSKGWAFPGEAAEHDEWTTTSWLQPGSIKPSASIKFIETLVALSAKEKTKTADLEARLQALTARLVKQERLLNDLINPSNLPQNGSFEDWLSSTEAEKYKGMHVAFSPNRGIIESSYSLDELVDKKSVKDCRDVILGFVSNFQ